MSALQKISSQMTLIPQQDLREVEGMNAFFIIPAKAKVVAGRALRDPPAAREAPRRARRDRAGDGPPGRPLAAGDSPGWALRDVLLRAQEALRAARGPAVRALDRADHAGDRARPEAGRRRRASRSSRSRPATSTASTATSRSSSAPPAESAGSKIERKTDTYGYEWVIVRDSDFEDLVTAVHLVASELKAQGFGAQLLAARVSLRGQRARIPSTGSTGSSAARSGRSSRPATSRSATTRPSSS